jgi:hypothetical protein
MFGRLPCHPLLREELDELVQRNLFISARVNILDEVLSLLLDISVRRLKLVFSWAVRVTEVGLEELLEFLLFNEAAMVLVDVLEAVRENFLDIRHLSDCEVRS